MSLYSTHGHNAFLTHNLLQAEQVLQQTHYKVLFAAFVHLTKLLPLHEKNNDIHVLICQWTMFGYV